jgi:hypothetical protein
MIVRTTASFEGKSGHTGAPVGMPKGRQNRPI